jgi:hypothetical protein
LWTFNLLKAALARAEEATGNEFGQVALNLGLRETRRMGLSAMPSSTWRRAARDIGSLPIMVQR